MYLKTRAMTILENSSFFLLRDQHPILTTEVPIASSHKCVAANKTTEIKEFRSLSVLQLRRQQLAPFQPPTPRIFATASSNDSVDRVPVLMGASPAAVRRCRPIRAVRTCTRCRGNRAQPCQETSRVGSCLPPTLHFCLYHRHPLRIGRQGWVFIRAVREQYHCHLLKVLHVIIWTRLLRHR